jgi:hypothetical protein
MNNTLEENHIKLVLCSKEKAIRIFDEKIKEITKLRDELFNVIEKINIKCEQMKNFL